MPLFHCDKCHHEWEGAAKDTFCSWCGGGSYVLQEKSEFGLWTAAAHEYLSLSPADSLAIAEALINPPEPTQNLIDAFKCYEEATNGKDQSPKETKV